MATMAVTENAAVEKKTKLMESKKFSHWTSENATKLAIAARRTLSSGLFLKRTNIR